MIILWMCDDCKNLYGAAVNRCPLCGSIDMLELDVSEPLEVQSDGGQSEAAD
jgi:ABC-type ATPase with predicted acetyltransferase domain